MKTLLIMSIIVFVGAEVYVTDVDEPIPVLEVTAVAGYKAHLPCDINTQKNDELVVMILWYREDMSSHPIYTLDGRKNGLYNGARNSSDQKLFGNRATMKIDNIPAQFIIDPLFKTDSGLYRCRVDYRNSPTKNQKINLTVIVPPNKPEITIGQDVNYSNKTIRIDEGSSIILICKVKGGTPQPRVSWYFGDKMIDDTYRYNHDDMTINKLEIARVTRDFENTKLYCRTSNTHLISPLVNDILLELNLKPLKVNITSKEAHLSALQTYVIECVTSGSKPEAVITWWKGSHQVKYMAKKITESPDVTKSILSYVATIGDDGKFLTCRAENPVVPDSALEDTWRLSIHYVPLVTIKLGSSLRSNDINERDDVYFECDVKANPKAYKLSWFKDEKELHQNSSAGIIIPGGDSLVLQNVNRASAGDYSCMAVNAEGSSTSKSVTLEVMYAPICKDGTLVQVVGALKHETISLVCGVVSKPPPITFHWAFNNSGELMMPVPAERYGPIKQTKRITNQWHGSRLNYTPDYDTDYGTISCWASNTIGVQRVPCLFQIIVAGKPYPLQNCSAVQSTGPYAYHTVDNDEKNIATSDAEWLIVHCTEGFDGGLPLTGFVLEVYKEDKIYPNITIYINRTDKINIHHQNGPIFQVPNLEPGKNYKLLVYAVNSKGKSDPVILESITLKGVAMYTTGRDSGDNNSDYSLLIACFVGSITALCITIIGITVTLYRRNYYTNQNNKSQINIVNCEEKDNDHNNQLPLSSTSTTTSSSTSTSTTASTTTTTSTSTTTRNNDNDYNNLNNKIKQSSRFINIKETREQLLIDGAEDNPDVIPCKLNSNYIKNNYNNINNDNNIDNLDYPSPASVLHGKDNWIYQNNYVDKPEATSPARPSTLPVHRTHDIYTRSLRVQESCI